MAEGVSGGFQESCATCSEMKRARQLFPARRSASTRQKQNEESPRLLNVNSGGRGKLLVNNNRLFIQNKSNLIVGFYEEHQSEY